MELKIVMPLSRGCSLSDLAPGEIFCFADSGKASQCFFEALQGFEQNFFMVFTDATRKDGMVPIVSFDGAQVLHRMGSRLVVELTSAAKKLHSAIYLGGTISPARSMACNVAPGNVVVYGIDPEALDALSSEKRLEFLYLVTKGIPTVSGMVTWISLRGKRIVVDDDLLVHTFDDAHFGFALKSK